MDEAFDARLDFDKGAEVGKANDGSGDALPGNKMLGSFVPRLGLELLEAKRDFPGFVVYFEDAELEFLARRRVRPQPWSMRP